MARPIPFQPHKLFVAALFSGAHQPDAVRALVERTFGPTDRELPAHPFTFSRYYDEEMGGGLHRALFSIRELVDPAELAAFKARSNEVELQTSTAPETSTAPRSRTLNLDPGLLSLSRVILATTKPSAPRVPLRDGFHAEITLLYRKGRYRPFEWTYPDFQSEPFVEWLADVRTVYHEQLRAIDPNRAWRL
jgi:hypothetical protein